MARALRLGLIGTGLAANALYRPAFDELGRRIALVSCTNRTRDKAAAFASVAGVAKVADSPEELLADPDVEAVVVSLPIDVMPTYVIAALAAGKAVLSEKPIAASVAAGRRLLRRAATYDRPYMVGENYAFMSHAHQLARWVAAGRLGTIRLVEVHQLAWMDETNAYARTAWRADPVHVGGFISDGGVHVANVVRRCFGDPVTVKGLTGSFDPALRPVDTAVAALRFPSGAVGTWTSCFSAHGTAPMIRVYGDRATAMWHRDHVELVAPNGAVIRAAVKGNSFTAQFRNFADVVTTGATMKVTPEETLGDLSLIERLLRGR